MRRILLLICMMLVLEAPGNAQSAVQGTPPPPGASASEAAKVPAGTTLRAELTTLLTTKTSRTGDPFTARVVEPIFAGGYEIIPANSTIDGHVAMVKPPGRATGRAEMRLIADSITTPEGTTFTVGAGLQSAEGTKVKDSEGTLEGAGKSTKSTAKEAGIDAGVGAGVGAIADGGTGALYGLGIGAVAAVAHNLLKHHKDVVLPQGTELNFMLARDAVATKSAEKPAEAANPPQQ